MKKAKKSIKKTVTVAQALRKANATPLASKAIRLHRSLTATGKELGTVLRQLKTRLVKIGCKGQFSQWLKDNGINRRTAYYAIDAANGKKRTAKKAKKGNKKSDELSVTALRKMAVATLKRQDVQTVMNTLRYVFSQCFPDSTADLQIVDASVMKAAGKGNVFVAKHSFSPAMASLAEAGLTVNKKGELVAKV